jgi:2-polyprenyl-6-methoxyphenol hydroxylase-like FAD-dependent oxidoreductase
MRGTDDVDVVVVGASIAGCTAATLLARHGARVALVERDPDPRAHKVACSHFLQPSAMPVLERLGVRDAMEAAGAVPNPLTVWTRWGWIAPSTRAHGLNLRRSVLDPLLRERATGTPGVEALLGATATALVHDGDRVAGVQVRTRDGRSRTLRARAVVGADGRGSRVARLAGVPARVRPHGRIAYLAHFRDLPLASGATSQMWLREPDVAYAFPNDDGLTVLVAMPAAARAGAFRRDPEAAFAAAFADLPDAPSLDRARRVSPFIGKLVLPNTSRPAAAGRVAFAGDAAMASDPLWGVGCGFALQSGAWLADLVGPALCDGRPVDGALRAYRRRHLRELAGHHWLMSDFSTGRPLNPLERLLFSAAARDAEAAEHLQAYGARTIGVGRFLHPRALVRAARVNAGVAALAGRA